MRLRFTKLTNELHRFEIVRDDGSREVRELETRSYLTHDLTHYAVEVEAQLTSSFYGRLARGISYDSLTAAPPTDHEVMQTERVVALIQSAAKRDDWTTLDVDTFAAACRASFTSTNGVPPVWVSGDLIARVRERLRRVQGQWRATQFQQTMELSFPPRDFLAAS